MIPEHEIEWRLNRFRDELRGDGLDGAVVVQSTDLAYLSGTNQQAHLVVPVEGDAVLLVRRTLRRAREESPLADVCELASLSGLPPALEAAGLASGSKIGLELDVLPAGRYLSYLSRLDGHVIGDCSPALRRTRAVKNEWELQRMRINSSGQTYVVRTAVAAMNRWVTSGQAPPRAPRLQLDAKSEAFVLDGNGNARGGIRTPHVDAPIASLSGLGQTGSSFCFLFGTTAPFDAAKLASLYASHAEFVKAWNTATDKAVKAGFLLPADAKNIKAAAVQSTVGGT